ncbi:hypothetical protein BDR05DRAFT_962999, partial [Suillus weaverae]
MFFFVVIVVMRFGKNLSVRVHPPEFRCEANVVERVINDSVCEDQDLLNDHKYVLLDII